MPKNTKQYNDKKEKLFKVIGTLLADQGQIVELLSAVNEKISPDNTAQGLSFGAKFKMLTKGAGFAVSHIGTLASAASFKDDAKELMDVLTQEKVLNPRKPPFLLTLLQDPDLPKFLTTNQGRLGNVIEQILPAMIPIVMAELSDINDLNATLQRRIAKQPERDKKIAKLSKSPLENKEEIEELQVKNDSIAILRDIRIPLAHALIKFNHSDGLGQSYLQNTLMPILLAASKTLLEKPHDLTTLAHSASNMAMAKDNKTRLTHLAEVLQKIDVTRFLKPTLTSFLASEGENMVKVAKIAVNSSLELQQTLQNNRISPQFIYELIPALSSTAATASTHNTQISDIYAAFQKIATNDVISAMEQATTLEQIEQLDKSASSLILNLLKSAGTLATQDEVLASIQTSLLPKLSNNSGLIADIIAHQMPSVIAAMQTEAESSAQTIAQTNALDLHSVLQIIQSPIVALQGVNPEFYRKALPPLIELSIKLLQMTSKEQLQDPSKHRDGMLYNITELSTDISSKLSPLLADDSIKQALSHIAGNLYEQQYNLAPQLQEIGISKKLLQDTAPLLANLTAQLTSNIMPALVMFDQYSKLTTPSLSNDERELALEQKQTHLSIITDQAIELLNEPFINAIKNNLSPFLTSHQDELSNVAAIAAKNNPTLKALGITADMASDLSKIAIEFTTLILQDTPGLMQIRDKFSQLRGCTDPAEVNEKAAALIAESHKFLNNPAIKDLVRNKLSGFVQDNLDKIIPLKPTLAVVDQHQVQGLINDSLALSNALTASLINHTPAALEIVTMAQKALAMPQDKKQLELLKTAGTTLLFINNHPEVKNIFTENLPHFIEKHAEPIGKIIDTMLQNDKLGKNLKIEGSTLATVISHHAEEIGAISYDYTQGNKASALLKGVKLLMNKDVIGLAIQAIGDFIKFKYHDTIVPGLFRRLEVGTAMNNSLQQAMGDMSEGNNDLGQKLEAMAENTDRRLLKHSLKNRDLRGFHFTESLHFNNMVIEQFNFENVIFEKKCSFKNSTIDAHSLNTLLPAIRQYNRAHQDDPITLDNMTITGDISNVNFKYVPVTTAKSSVAWQEKIAAEREAPLKHGIYTVAHL